MRANVALSVVGLGVLLTSVACSKPPTGEIDAARQSLETTRAEDAAEYAPDDFAKAEDAMAKLDAELKAQEDRFGLLRSYDEAKRLAEEADRAATEAAEAAAARKQIVRDEASDTIAEAKATLTEVKTLLDKAPRGKGTQADLAVLKSDLAGVETALGEVDDAFASGRYLEAKTKAEAAMASAQSVRDVIEQAMAARRRGRS